MGIRAKRAVLVEPQYYCADDHLGHRIDRLPPRVPGSISSQDGPRAMDRGRPWIWSGVRLVVNGRRDLYHVHFSRGKRLGIFQGWSGAVRVGICAVDVRRFLLHPSTTVGSWQEAWATDAS